MPVVAGFPQRLNFWWPWRSFFCTHPFDQATPAIRGSGCESRCWARASALLHLQQAEPPGFSNGVLRRGPANPCPGRDRVYMQPAAAMLARLVSDDAEHGELPCREFAGECRRHRARDSRNSRKLPGIAIRPVQLFVGLRSKSADEFRRWAARCCRR